MDRKTAAAIERLKQNKGLAEQLMHSGDGKKLMNLLSAADGGKALNRAAGAAAGGDTRELSQMLQNLMNNPEAAEAMNRLNQSVLKNN